MWLKTEERSRLMPDGHELFGNCHASSIVLLPGGERLVAFFAGLREGEPDNAIWLVRWRDGVWQPPERRFAKPGLPHWNPILHAEGAEVWLFYKTGTTVHDWTNQITHSPDGGRSWTPSRPLVPGDASLRGPVRNKLLVLQSGAWLAPGSVEDTKHWDAFTDRSEDHGATWRQAPVPIQHLAEGAQDRVAVWEGLKADALWETDLDRVFAWDGVIQPSLWESTPGQVHMLLRSTRGWVYRSDSTDDGRSWGTAYATALPNNNSGLDAVRLTDGRLLLVYNPVGGNWGRRTPLSLAGSADSGQTWTRLLDLETDEGEFSYPAIIAAADQVHVTYTWNRTNIIHHRFRLTAS